MKDFRIIGWVRDRRGVVISRPLKTYCNAVTSFIGGSGYRGTPPWEGMGNTTPYVLEAIES